MKNLFSNDVYADVIKTADTTLTNAQEEEGKRKAVKAIIVSKTKEAASLAGLNKPAFREHIIESLLPRGLVSSYKFARGFSPKGIAKTDVRTAIMDYTQLLDRDAKNKNLKTPLKKYAQHVGTDTPEGIDAVLEEMDKNWSAIKRGKASSSISSNTGISDNGQVIDALAQQSRDSVIAAKDIADEQETNKQITTTIQNLKRNNILNAQGEVLTRMSNTMQMMQRYQDTVTRRYQVTNLKLQYEQVTLLKTLLKSKLVSDKISRAQANAIITNTSLPWVNKATITDLAKFNLKQHAAELVSNEITKYKKAALRNVKRILRKNVGLDSVTSALQKQNLVGVGKDDYLDASTNTFLSRIMDRFREGTERTLYGGKRFSKVGSLIQAIPLRINRFIRDNQKETTLKGRLARTVKNTMRRVGSSTRNVASMPYGISEKAVFDGRTYTSINTIIPGWLSKISHGVNKITNDKAKAETFIWSSQSFNTKEAVASSIKDAARAMPGVINTKEAVNEIMRVINKRNKLPPDLHKLVRRMVVDQVARNAKTDSPIEMLTRLDDLLTGDVFKSLGASKRRRIKRVIKKTTKSLDISQVAGIANALLSGSNTGELEQLTTSLIKFYGVNPLLDANIIYPDGGEYYLSPKFIEATIRDSAGTKGGFGAPKSFGRDAGDIERGPSLLSRIKAQLGIKTKEEKQKEEEAKRSVWGRIKSLFVKSKDVDLRERFSDLGDRIKKTGNKVVDSAISSAIDIKSWGEGIASDTQKRNGSEKFRGENRLRYVADLVKNVTVEGSRFAANTLRSSIKGVADTAKDKLQDGIKTSANAAAERFKTAIYGDNEDFKSAIIALAMTGRDKLKDVAVGTKGSVVETYKGIYGSAKEWTEGDGKKRSMSMLDYIDTKIAEGWLGMIPGISRDKAAARIVLRSEEMARLEKISKIRSKIVDGEETTSGLDTFFSKKKKKDKGEEKEDEKKEEEKEISRAKQIGLAIASSMGKAAVAPFKKAGSLIKSSAKQVYEETRDYLEIGRRIQDNIDDFKARKKDIKSRIQDAYYSKRAEWDDKTAKKWLNMPDSYKRTRMLNKYVLRGQGFQKKADEAKKGIIKKLVKNPNELTPDQMAHFTKIHKHPVLRKKMEDILEGYRWVESYYGYKPKNDMELKVSLVDALLTGDDGKEEQLYYLELCRKNATKNAGKEISVEDLLDIAKTEFFKTEKAKVVSSITDRPKNFKARKKTKPTFQPQGEYLSSIDDNVKRLTDFILNKGKPTKPTKSVLPTYKSMTEQDINDALKKAIENDTALGFNDLNNDGNKDGSFKDVISRRAARNKKTSSSIEKPKVLNKTKKDLLDYLGPMGKVMGGIMSLAGGGISFVGNLIGAAMKLGPLALPLIGSLGLGKLGGLFGKAKGLFGRVPFVGSLLGTASALFSKAGNLGKLFDNLSKAGAVGTMASMAGGILSRLRRKGKGKMGGFIPSFGGASCCGCDPGLDGGGSGSKKKGKKGSKVKKAGKGGKLSKATSAIKNTAGKASAVASKAGKGIWNVIKSTPGGWKTKIMAGLGIGVATALASSSASASEPPSHLTDGTTNPPPTDGTDTVIPPSNKPAYNISPDIETPRMFDDIVPHKEGNYNVVDRIARNKVVTTVLLPASLLDMTRDALSVKDSKLLGKARGALGIIMDNVVSPITAKIKPLILGLLSTDKKSKVSLFKELAGMRMREAMTVIKDLWKVAWRLIVPGVAEKAIGRILVTVFKVALSFIGKVLMPPMVIRDAYVMGRYVGDILQWGLDKMDVHLGIMFYDLMDQFGWNEVLHSLNFDSVANKVRDWRSKLGIDPVYDVLDAYAVDAMEFVADNHEKAVGGLANVFLSIDNWWNNRDENEFLKDTPIPNKVSKANRKPLVNTSISSAPSNYLGTPEPTPSVSKPELSGDAKYGTKPDSYFTNTPTKPVSSTSSKPIKVSTKPIIVTSVSVPKKPPRTTRSAGRNIGVGYTPNEGEDGIPPLTLGRRSKRVRGRHRKYSKFTGTKVYLSTKLDFKYLRMGSRVRTSHANKALLMCLQAMGKDYYRKTKRKLSVNSIYRNRADQIRLRRKYGSRAAPPGSSLHEFGLAIDLNTPALNTLDRLGLLNKYGFVRPLGTESWHIEPIGIQWGRSRAKRDAKYSYVRILDGLGHGGGGPIGRHKGRSRNDNLMRKIWEDGKDVTVVIDGEEPNIHSSTKVKDTPTGGSKVETANTAKTTTKKLSATIPSSEETVRKMYKPYIPKRLEDGSINPAYETTHPSDASEEGTKPKVDSQPQISVNVPEPKVVLQPDGVLANSVDKHASKTDVTNVLLQKVVAQLEAINTPTKVEITPPKDTMVSKPLTGDSFGVS